MKFFTIVLTFLFVGFVEVMASHSHSHEHGGGYYGGNYGRGYYGGNYGSGYYGGSGYYPQQQWPYFGKK